jgi:lipoprotein-anchoring transpeptidase ErfK/SrfK
MSKRTRLLLLFGWIPVVAAIVSTSHIVSRMRANAAPMRLKVDLSERRLYVIESGDVVRIYGIAVGSRRYPTPTGSFRTGRIDWNPAWNPPNSAWARKYTPKRPGDPRNPMQGVKIYFKYPAYFIHGTNDPGSIGGAASHGCIRMTEGDAKSLARRIQKHGSVPLVIQR